MSHKFIVIVRLDRTIQNSLKKVDSRLRTAGMTNSEREFMHRDYVIHYIVGEQATHHWAKLLFESAR
jgi:hypothetical protein